MIETTPRAAPAAAVGLAVNGVDACGRDQAASAFSSSCSRTRTRSSPGRAARRAAALLQLGRLDARAIGTGARTAAAVLVLALAGCVTSSLALGVGAV